MPTAVKTIDQNSTQKVKNKIKKLKANFNETYSTKHAQIFRVEPFLKTTNRQSIFEQSISESLFKLIDFWHRIRRCGLVSSQI